MALTVGELNGIISIDDRAVNPALRRAEQALRRAGSNMGSDAERSGQQAGQQLGGGFVRGADGQWRNMQAQLVDAVTAATLEAEAQARRGGQQIGAGVTTGMHGLRTSAAHAGQQAGDALGDGLSDGASAGADDAVAETESKLSKLKTVALGAGAAAGAYLTEALGQAVEQGQLTGKLQAQLGTTPAIAKQYGSIAGSLYKEGVVGGFEEGTDTMRQIASAGLIPPGATNAQIKSIATHAADLANTFDVDLSLAALGAGSAVKNGLAKDSKEAFDLLSAGMTGLGPGAEDLVETFSEYGPIFKSAGLSGATSLGLIRQAIQGGWVKDTDKVADAFKEFQLRGTEGSKGVQDAFKALGMDAKKTGDDIAAGGKRGERAMGTVLDKLRKLGPNSAEAKQIVSTLFGGPGEDLGAALFSLDMDKASKAMGNTAGAADKLGSGLRDNAGAQLTSFKNTLQQNVVEFLGSSVIPKLMTFFGFVQEHSGIFKIAAISVIALGAAFAVASIGVWAMNSAMLANPMFWIIAGIAAAVVGLVMLITTYWSQIKNATLVAWGGIVTALTWAKDMLVAVFMNFTLPGLIYSHWSLIKSVTLSVWNWVVGFVKAIPGALSSFFFNWTLPGLIIKHWSAIKNGTVRKAGEMLAWVRGLPGRISSAMGTLSSLLTQKGRNLVQGLWVGVQGMGGWIKSKLIGWAKSMIPGPIAKALGINSPSKVTAAQGRWIARGLIDGLTGSSKQVRAASTKLADIVADSMKPSARRSKTLGAVSAGSKQLLKLASQEEKLAARLKTATKSLADQMKARDALAADVKKGVLDDANITKQESTGWPQTAETILAGLKQDTAASQLFAKNLAALRKKGVRSDLIAQIAQAGVAGGSSAAAALANANAGQVRQINSQQAALVKAAGQAGTTAGDAMYGAGIHAAQGLVKGLQSQQKAIEAQMMRIAKGMSKSIRAALGIKSPSRVMALVGQYTAQGLIKGVDSQRGAIHASMQSLVDTPAPGSWDSASARARAAAVQRTVLEIRSSGRAEDDYILGKVRRGIRKVAGSDVDMALVGKRSG
ncbi:phage tail tape measure protein [Streptomyces sp. NPDC056785]|uniref:phage tail tape measure protein n=1 Tax=Streptomyces sp. NPDC056785 TaxID=3345944 RepID=UPI00367F62FF